MALAVVKLDPDMRIASHSSTHGLFRNSDCATQWEQHNVGSPDLCGLMGSLGIVLKNQLHLDASQHDFSLQCYLRTSRIVASAFVDDALNLHRDGEFRGGQGAGVCRCSNE